MRPRRAVRVLLLGLGDLFQEVAAERIVRPSDRAVRLAHELRDEMEVSDRAEEHGQVPEDLIDADLLQVGLRETLRVRGVLLVRPFDQHLSGTAHSFAANARAPLVVLMECDLVLPGSLLSFLLELDGYLHVRVPAGSQTANAADSATARIEDRFPEATAGESDVAEKAKGIQKVGLPRRVGAHQKQAIPDRDLDPQEVLPVPQTQAPETQILAHDPSRPRRLPRHQAGAGAETGGCRMPVTRRQ